MEGLDSYQKAEIGGWWQTYRVIVVQRTSFNQASTNGLTCSLTKATLQVPAEPEARLLPLPLAAPFLQSCAAETFARLLLLDPAPLPLPVSSKLKLDMLAGRPPAPFVADSAGDERTDDCSLGAMEGSGGPS